jgi:hypothetical protein
MASSPLPFPLPPPLPPLKTKMFFQVRERDRGKKEKPLNNIVIKVIIPSLSAQRAKRKKLPSLSKAKTGKSQKDTRRWLM